jgi:hypothetical protein
MSFVISVMYIQMKEIGAELIVWLAMGRKQ